MRKAFAAVAAGLLLCFASHAMALGFGPVSNATRLGQPLDFGVAVRLEGDEALAAQCIAAEVTAGDQRVPAQQVRTRLVRGATPSEATVKVSTTSRITEPVVTVQLALGCPPRASHKFVSLLDPPRGGAARQPAPAPTALPVEAAASAVTPGTPASGAQAQLGALEERIERLRLEQQATQQSIASLQAKLRESEEVRRHSDPALYGLTALVVLLLVVIAVLLWRQARERSEQAWQRDSQALTDTGSRPFDIERMSPVSPAFDEVTMTSMRVVPESSLGGALDEAPTRAESSVRDAIQTTTIPSAARMRRELTGEELIDLEQQADFFIALGEEEAAIDLLMGHVRSSGGTSPMPYLKLLEIYRRRSDGEAYERIRERFNRRFNAHAPAWESDPLQGRALAAYPDIVARLQSVWSVPARASDLLESLLFRRDNSHGTFDLPAYEELLFLYALVRDLVERERMPDGVDLLLPLDHSAETPAIVRAEAARPREPQAGKPVDLELDFDAPRPPTP
ncbi:hypothetical protein [Piscinibacter sp. XHJ-5]|uniref:type IV pilus assembly protein FimV n=1 Tax=Piscinibacter sp. XHJ-5 TaxID=3037797 RepID=UPI002452DDA0|nr:hypothetical protein [Piscinibacter sp. XHJ-5]